MDSLKTGLLAEAPSDGNLSPGLDLRPEVNKSLIYLRKVEAAGRMSQGPTPPLIEAPSREYLVV